MIVFETAPSPLGWQLSRDGARVEIYPSQQAAEEAAQRIAQATRDAGSNVRLLFKRQDHTISREILLH